LIPSKVLDFEGESPFSPREFSDCLRFFPHDTQKCFRKMIQEGAGSGDDKD
jgi:hypothetical protein